MADISKLREEIDALDDNDYWMLMNNVQWQRMLKDRGRILQESKEKEKEYAGRYYTDGEGHYYKILNFRYYPNRYCPEALKVWAAPAYSWHSSRHLRTEAADEVLGSTDFEGIEVTSLDNIFPVGYIEITEEEFNKVLDNFIEKLKKLEWRSDK